MKILLKVLILSILISSCSTNKYLLTDSNKGDKKFLINKIKTAKANGEIDSKKPILVIDGKPHRFTHELKENKLSLSKSNIKTIQILKKDVGVKIYGEFAQGGVLVITTIDDQPKEIASTNSEDSLDNKNILFFVDGKEVDNEYIKSISPNDIETIQVLKGEAAEKLYPNKNLDGVIIIKMKKG